MLQTVPEAQEWVFFSDKLVNDTPKMTSSASQPDLLGGWDSWAAGKTASTSAAANKSKSSYANTGDTGTLALPFELGLPVNVQIYKRKKSPECSDSETSVPVASGAPSMSKAKSQTFDPFADLGNLGSNLPGKVPVCSDRPKKRWSPSTYLSFMTLQLPLGPLLVQRLLLQSLKPSPGSLEDPPQPRTNPGCLGQDLAPQPNHPPRLSLQAHSPTNPTTT